MNSYLTVLHMQRLDAFSPDQLRTLPAWPSHVLEASSTIRLSLVLHPHFMTQAEGRKMQQIPRSHAHQLQLALLCWKQAEILRNYLLHSGTK